MKWKIKETKNEWDKEACEKIKDLLMKYIKTQSYTSQLTKIFSTPGEETA